MKFKKQKTAIAALAFLMLLVVFSIIGEMIVPYGVDEYDYSSVLQGPSQSHLFGTDEFGRDIFSRVILGARISLAVVY
jgi:glutathione transport system permease protein